MKNLRNAIILLVTIVSCTTERATNNEEALKQSLTKLRYTIEAYADVDKNPRTLSDSATVEFVHSGDWTSGFYPGCLWYAYELSNDPLFQQSAIERTRLIEDQKLNSKTHDMGFKMYCSFGHAYRITKDSCYRDILLTSAEHLAKRYNPKVGCIRSWDHNADKWDFPVIIDNMMNLELLMWAFKETGDSTYYRISVSHADKTMENHFRDDFSCYHVIDYDPETGEVEHRQTHQGYADNSSWARGQAWALYGYTMMYRETGRQTYLERANAIASFILQHKNLPEDRIPYWDFDAPNIPDEPRDASAAAVICSALYELSEYSQSKQDQYIQEADNILASLCSDAYLSNVSANHYFLLEHSTGSFPHNSEIDVPLIYADYYFLESILRKKNLESTNR